VSIIGYVVYFSIALGVIIFFYLDGHKRGFDKGYSKGCQDGWKECAKLHDDMK